MYDLIVIELYLGRYIISIALSLFFDGLLKMLNPYYINCVILALLTSRCCCRRHHFVVTIPLSLKISSIVSFILSHHVA